MSDPSVRDLVTFHYECLQGMYFSEFHRRGASALLFSNLVEDPYYNFFAPEASDATTVLPEDVVEEFTKRGRQPAVYLTPLAATIDSFPDDKVWARDSWLIGALPSLDTKRADESVQVLTVDSSRREEYVVTFAAAYSGDDPADPYGQLNPAYTEALKNSFDATPSGYRKHYVLAEAGGVPVGVAAMFTKGPLAGVYGVGTVSPHRRHGIGSAIMAYLAQIAAADGVDHIMLQTEEGSDVQRWYEGLAYRHVFTAPYVLIS